MRALNTVAARWPRTFVLVVMAVAVALTEIDATTPDHPDAYFLTGIVGQGLVAVALIVFIRRIGLLPGAGFGAPRPWRSVALAWPLVVLTLINASELATGDLHLEAGQPLRITLFVLLYCTTGLFEEVLCRGLMLNLFLRQWGGTQRGVLVAVLTSGAYFGLAHLITVAVGRSTLAAGAVQAVYAFFIGVLFAAIFIRTGSIWPGVALHALFNIAGSLRMISVEGVSSAPTSTTVADATSAIGLCFLVFVYGLFLLRRAVPSQTSQVSVLV